MYQQIVRLIKKDAKTLLSLVILLLGAILLGDVLPIISPKLAHMIQQLVISKLSGIRHLFVNAPFWLQIMVIFLNNLFASLIAIAIGILLIPFLPLLVLLFNGVMIGLFHYVVVLKTHLSWYLYFLVLLPHGIFELSAIILAVMLGYRLSLLPYRFFGRLIVDGSYLPCFKSYFRELPTYLLLILILLFIAAVFEVMVSPLLMRILGLKSIGI